MNHETTEQFFKELCGSQLSSVEFVQDYLQLRFDGPCINVMTPVTVRPDQQEITSLADRFRDLLFGTGRRNAQY